MEWSFEGMFWTVLFANVIIMVTSILDSMAQRKKNTLLLKVLALIPEDIIESALESVES